MRQTEFERWCITGGQGYGGTRVRGEHRGYGVHRDWKSRTRRHAGGSASDQFDQSEERRVGPRTSVDTRLYRKREALHFRLIRSLSASIGLAFIQSTSLANAVVTNFSSWKGTPNR